MIKLLVINDDHSTEINLPTDMVSLQRELYKIGIREHASNINLIDSNENSYKIKYSSDSDFGNKIIKLFNGSDSLEDINTCVNKISNSRTEILEELEGDILHEQFETLTDLMDEIDCITKELINSSVNYYCPLRVGMYSDEERYGRIVIQVPNSCADNNEESVREKLVAVQKELFDCIVYNLDNFESLKEKIVYANWDVSKVNDTLYGVIHTHLTETLTPEEEQIWIDELKSQASGGFGEEFEQVEISTDNGGIFVSFWSTDDNYFMENENDFQIRIADEQNIGIQM